LIYLDIYKMSSSCEVFSPGNLVRLAHAGYWFIFFFYMLKLLKI